MVSSLLENNQSRSSCPLNAGSSFELENNIRGPCPLIGRTLHDCGARGKAAGMFSSMLCDSIPQFQTSRIKFTTSGSRTTVQRRVEQSPAFTEREYSIVFIFQENTETSRLTIEERIGKPCPAPPIKEQRSPISQPGIWHQISRLWPPRAMGFLAELPAALQQHRME